MLLPSYPLYRYDRYMKRIGLILVALMLAGGAGVAIARGSGSFSQVYSVREVRAGIARHPSAWLGRTVLVRAIASGAWLPLAIGGPGSGSGFTVMWFYGGRGRPLPSTRTILPSALLTDSSTQAPAAGLPLAFGGEDPLLSFLRRLPWIGRFMPRPRSLNWGSPAIYHVRLQSAPAGSCGHAICYEAVLLDAVPRANVLLHVAAVLLPTRARMAIKPRPIIMPPHTLPHHVAIPALPAAP